METRFFGLEPATSLRLLAIGMATLVSLIVLIAVARRRRTYWWTPVALVAVSYAGVALSSALAALMVMRTFEEVTVTGRAMDIVFSIWQATQLPLVAAWTGIAAALVAAGLALRADAPPPSDGAGKRRPALVAFAAGLALASGIVPVLLFRRSIGFLMREITPDTNTYGGEALVQAIVTNLTTTAAISAGCFLVVAALVVATLRMARRTQPAPRLSFVTAIVLVLSLAVSAALATNLRSQSTRFRNMALYGQFTSR